MRSEVDLKSGTDFFACHRGADELGTMSTHWFQINKSPLCLEAAKQECQKLFESGLLYHPQVSEFRISRPDGSTVLVANPPHSEPLTWRKFSI